MRLTNIQAAVLRRMSSSSGSGYGVLAGSPFASQRASIMSNSLRSASGWVCHLPDFDVFTLFTLALLTTLQLSFDY